MKPGKFITLEGGEGAGKSTQARHLVDYLGTHGIKAIATREVGGAPAAEEIRDLWLGKGEGHWDPVTELLLIMAARREHLVRTIWPALESGVWIVSDRFVDSSRAYQGVALGLGIEKVDEVYEQVAGEFWPDLTLLLDVPVDVGLARMASRNGPDDRYQRQKKPFHEKLRQAYLGMAKNEPKRFAVIDASADESAVSSAIEAAVAKHFGLPQKA
jgi:dTMP kinase